jgi:hypothetical protein
LGEPKAAIEILNRHVEDVERHVVAPKYVAIYHLYRVIWRLSAALEVEGDEGKRGPYVAEAKGLMERATRSLRGLRPHDWSDFVSGSISG